MSSEKTSAAEGLVTSDGVTAGARLRKRAMLVTGIILAVGTLSAGTWFVLTQTSLFSRQAAFQRKDLSTLSPSAAVQAAKGEVGEAQTSSQKTQAYMDLGQAYVRNSQNDQAINAYKQAVSASSSGSNSSSSSGGNTDGKLAALAQLASAYDTNGNVAQTIAVFEQIIAVLKQSNDPSLTEQIPKYQAAIERLKTEGHI